VLKAELQDFRLVAGDRFAEAELGLRLASAARRCAKRCFDCATKVSLGVDPKLGWYVLPIDFDRLDQLYDLRLVLELASIARLCMRADVPIEIDALKPIWLVAATERIAEPRTVGAQGRDVPRRARSRHGNDEMARVHWDVTERIRLIRRLDFTRASRIEATYVEHARILRACCSARPTRRSCSSGPTSSRAKAEVRRSPCTRSPLRARGRREA
jgi:hypothetical protein